MPAQSEFLVDAHLNFYFLEVNTRLQVEHRSPSRLPASISSNSIAIAAGHRLPFAWESITPAGHAMEVRLYAEDPDNNFFPSPGKNSFMPCSGGPGIAWMMGVYEAGLFQRLRSSAQQTGSPGATAARRPSRDFAEPSRVHRYRIKTNTGLFRRILADPNFLCAANSTRSGSMNCWPPRLRRVSIVRGDECSALQMPPPLPPPSGKQASVIDIPVCPLPLRILSSLPAGTRRPARPIDRES